MNLEAIKKHMLALFEEVTRLRSENAELKKEIKSLKRSKKSGEIKKQIAEQEEREDLAFYIKSQREARGLSQTYFGRLVGANSTTISNYENGKGSIESSHCITYRETGSERM